MTDQSIRAPAAKPKRRKRIFLWFFLVVQGIFLALLIAGLLGNAGSGEPAHGQAIAYCSNGGWHGLYSSYNDCLAHYGNPVNAAGTIGRGIGVGLILGLWAGVDVILGIGRLVVVLGRRRRR